MDVEDYNLIVENANKFGISNLVPVLGEAPKAWESLPDPEAIFVGGTGRAVTDLVGQLATLATGRGTGCKHDEHGEFSCAATTLYS